MQVADIILGLLIILLTAWAVMMAVQLHSVNLSLQALEAKQVAQGIQISPNKCNAMQEYRLADATEIVEGQYLTTVGFDHDRNQVYFCFYESK